MTGQAQIDLPAEPVLALFERVRGAGLSCVDGAMLPGIQALGAPVFDAEGQLSAVLTVLGTEGSFDFSFGGAAASALSAAAEGLSHRLGAGVNNRFEKGQV